MDGCLRLVKKRPKITMAELILRFPLILNPLVLILKNGDVPFAFFDADILDMSYTLTDERNVCGYCYTTDMGNIASGF